MMNSLYSCKVVWGDEILLNLRINAPSNNEETDTSKFSAKKISHKLVSVCWCKKFKICTSVSYKQTRQIPI